MARLGATHHPSWRLVTRITERLADAADLGDRLEPGLFAGDPGAIGQDPPPAAGPAEQDLLVLNAVANPGLADRLVRHGEDLRVAVAAAIHVGPDDPQLPRLVVKLLFEHRQEDLRVARCLRGDRGRLGCGGSWRCSRWRCTGSGRRGWRAG